MSPLCLLRRWFCHVDDDNYVNVRTLVKLLSQYPHTQDMYLGKPSLDRPIEATERLGDNKMVRGRFLPLVSDHLLLLDHLVLTNFIPCPYRNQSTSGSRPEGQASV